jgi:CubicO group peptidase (beta-lactamase class C family)
MRLAVILSSVATLFGAVVVGAPNCPPLGPVFPKPLLADLKNSPAVKAAIANLTATLAARDADNSTGAYATSYGIEVFTAKDKEPIFSWYHTAPNLTVTYANGNKTPGVTTVDRNSVYRLGSLTKIFTILTWLVQDGDTRWNEPITKYIPELAQKAAEAKFKSDPINYVDWDDVTIGAMASQMTGLIRDCKFLLLLYIGLIWKLT